MVINHLLTGMILQVMDDAFDVTSPAPVLLCWDVVTASTEVRLMDCEGVQGEALVTSWKNTSRKPQVLLTKVELGS